MAATRLAAVAGALLFCGVHAFDWQLWSEPYSAHHATSDLTTTTFESHLKEHPVTAIMFYASWCFYSQQAMAMWDIASQKLSIHDPPVKLAKIDAHRYRSIGEQYGINAFPMMKLFVDGKVFEYNSQQGRGWQQIVKWVNLHVDRDHLLKDVEDAEHFLHDNDLNVVGLFPDGYDSNVTFVKSARHFEDVMFAEARGTEIATKISKHISRHAALVCETVSVGKSQENKKSVDLPREMMACGNEPRNPQHADWTDQFEASVEAKSLTVKRLDQPMGWEQNLALKCCDQSVRDTDQEKYLVPVPSVVMFMPHDERFAIYDGKLEDGNSLDRWIQTRRMPMVTTLTTDTADKVFARGQWSLPVLFFIAEQEPGLEQTMREAAKSVRGRVSVCFAGASNLADRRLMELVGVDRSQLPVVALLTAKGEDNGPHQSANKFRLATEGLNVARVIQFVDDYEGGKLKPWLKSEPEPTAEDFSGPVGVLVGTTFTATVEDESVDVLVDFYAPWCGHCRKFEPAYNELAKRLRHVKTLRIMKLDATRNEVEGLRITGFPTIMLFPGGRNGQNVQYNGNRQPEDLIQWLHAHSTFKFDDRPPKEAPPSPRESGLLDADEEDL